MLSLGKLPIGKYLLTETETNPGYNLPEEDVRIEVTADGVSYQLNATSQPIRAEKKTVTEDGKTVIYSMIEVPNSTGAMLPSTGGPGTAWIYLMGLLLITFAGGGLALKRILFRV